MDVASWTSFPPMLLLPPAWREPMLTTVIPFVVAVLVVCVTSSIALRMLRRLIWGTLELRDRVVVITGAGSGIGKELAIAFGDAGCRLVLVDLRGNLLQSVAKELVAHHNVDPARISAWACDVSDSKAVAQLVDKVNRAVAPAHVSVLVNNAGVVMGKPLAELTDEQITRTMGVNCLAHFWLARGFLPQMEAANDGVVVGMSSLMGLMSGAALTDYCASKHAVVGFMESLRLGLRRRKRWGVSTLTVCPFAVDTGMFSGIFRSDASDSFVRRTLFPLLTGEAVARRVVDAVRARESLAVMPAILRFLPFVAKLFPMGLYDWAVEIMAGCHGMDEFSGRGIAWTMGADAQMAKPGQALAVALPSVASASRKRLAPAAAPPNASCSGPSCAGGDAASAGTDSDDGVGTKPGKGAVDGSVDSVKADTRAE